MKKAMTVKSIRPTFMLATIAIVPVVFVLACSSRPMPSGGSHGGGGSAGGGATATATSTSDLCYGPFDCNGDVVEQQCFSNQADYCDALCSETNCVAQIFCQSDCN